jgi:tetratricopeptide (TPR) repeat protein
MTASAAPAQADEAPVWAELGRWRLERGESQAALLAFKRAEALTPSEPGKEQMRLSQARALVQLGQGPAAMDVLVRLALVTSSSVSRPALATLGSLKFQQGQVQQSLALLKKAVEEGAAGYWTGRNEAEADLGLAYLTAGNEANGLRWLHVAQDHFGKASDQAMLSQCLENEAAYLEHVGKAQEAAALRERRRLAGGE